MNKDPDVFPNSYIYHELDFGQTYLGGALIKKITFKNASKGRLHYIATRDPKTNPIYHVFDLNKYEFCADSGAEINLKIIYQPSVSGVIDFDYFKIIDTDVNLIKIGVKGECIGPKIVGSVANLRFFKTPSINLNETFKIFELKNLSELIATDFHFDESDQDSGTFRLDKLRGTLAPSKFLHITVKFHPESPGYYSKNLTCLFTNHEPVIINLFGVYSLEEIDLRTIDYQPYPLPLEDRVGFSGYLSDSVTVRKTIPPVSLSCNCIDFGGAAPTETKCQTLTTNLTNHMESPVFVQWETDKNFEIVPNCLRLPEGKSALFECKFHPQSESQLFGKILQGLVFWGDSDMNIPLPITLRAIGHSFPGNQSWIPDVTTIPNVVILPLTLPTYPSFASFTIKCSGHLPVLFKNFVAKPCMGLIRSSQIVIVQLQSKSPIPSSFIETWTIELNGRLDSSVQIYIKCQTDLPSITVSRDNILEFEPVQPGCQGFMFATIHNNSSCPLVYFVGNDENLGFGICPQSARLGAHEEAFVNASCLVQDEEDREFFVKCRAQAVLAHNAITGPPTEILVKVISKVSYTQLCATPKYCNVGEVSWGSEITLRFYLFNFGDSNVNFYLGNVLDGDDELGDFSISPRHGKCGPKEKVMVVITFKAKQTGSKNLGITYWDRINEYSDQVSENPPTEVYTFDFICTYPTIQIGEILEHNFGALFSRFELWEMLDLDRINSHLRHLAHGETVIIDLRVPECEIGEKMYTIKFLVENRTNFDTFLGLKRRQNCDCKPKEVSQGLTMRKKILECPHKEVATLEVSSVIIKANSKAILSLKLCYFLPNLTTMTYMCELSDDRRLEINICVFTIPKEEPVLSVYSLTNELNLGQVFMGLREAPLRAFWVYNNTSTPLPVEIDDVEILKLCNSEGFDVFKCLSCVGVVKPFTCAPLLFRFSPIEEKLYQIQVPLLLGTKVISLSLYGEGAGTVKSWYDKEDDNQTSSDYLGACPVRLSKEFFKIEPILVWNSTERLIFIKNTTKDEIHYKFKPCFIDGIGKITYSSCDGLLKDKEIHTIVIKIETLSEPASLRFHINCEVFSKTQFILHEESLAEYAKRQLITTEEFTITEKGISYPEIKEKQFEIIPAPEIFHLSVQIELNSVSELDKDICLPIDCQFKQIPYKCVDINAEEIIQGDNSRTFSEETFIQTDKKTLENVLHCLAADAVFSAYFLQSLRDLQEEPTPLYSQIRYDPSEIIQAKKTKSQLKKENVLEFLNKPQLPEVASVIQEAAIDSIHDTFQLGAPLRKYCD